MYIKNNGKHLPTTLGRDFFAPTYYQSKRLSMHYFHSYCLENTKKKIRTPKNMGCNWQISIFEFFTNIMDNFSTFFFQKHKGKSAYLKC